MVPGRWRGGTLRMYLTGWATMPSGSPSSTLPYRQSTIVRSVGLQLAREFNQWTGGSGHARREVGRCGIEMDPIQGKVPEGCSPLSLFGEWKPSWRWTLGMQSSSVHGGGMADGGPQRGTYMRDPACWRGRHFEKEEWRARGGVDSRAKL